MININNIKLISNISEYEMDCPNCNKKFTTTKTIINSAILHKQKSIYCNKICAFEGRKVSKDTLAQRIIDFYKEHNRVPTFKDFKMSHTYRKRFGNWTNALKYAGLYEKRNEIRKEKSKNRNTWERQKNLHLERKKELVKMKGGKCQMCGYQKNYAALVFHHRDPSKKEIALDARCLANISTPRLLAEVEKCDLLCSNCHFELHNPHLKL
jgi:hypothetical protein